MINHHERCGWAGPEQIYIDYHDTEWGVPEYDSRALWEKLILDGFQAGLSWITILKKRDNFRAAFEGFQPEIIAEWGEADVRRLLCDAGIIRHRGKIEATIGNARAYLEVEAREGFDRFLWSYVDGVPLRTTLSDRALMPTQSPLSAQISKDLKRNGFRFCGPTIVYAFMEATGLINNHLTGCFRHAPCAAMARDRAEVLG
ncbi:DNA-3-methyladenine glycosylase I [Yoonia litorea]|uniref:DNA-3-methyladenine glycosylase I n=1 Tax=Yoonia litorea TaxID=1123755 RepID=A0A1I6N2N5_9RHOB|nr:DNA-3-methyladenine glycosylase I [Yoonia litorea]SFS22196.1 DNA-3-methyladenine glycosylase I [Yoonia litorea]